MCSETCCTGPSYRSPFTGLCTMCKRRPTPDVSSTRWIPRGTRCVTVFGCRHHTSNTMAHACKGSCPSTSYGKVGKSIRAKNSAMYHPPANNATSSIYTTSSRGFASSHNADIVIRAVSFAVRDRDGFPWLEAMSVLEIRLAFGAGVEVHFEAFFVGFGRCPI